MLDKLPYYVRHLFKRISQFLAQLHYQLTHSNPRMQLRTRPNPGQLLSPRLVPGNPASNSNRKVVKRFTAAEIKAYLQGGPQLDRERARTIANQFQIGRLSELLNRPMPRRFNGRERLFQRLSLVIVRYAQGVSPAEIAESLSCFYKPEDIEEAIDYVANIVAASLNRSHSFWF